MRLLCLIEKTVSIKNSSETLDYLKQALSLFLLFASKGRERSAVRAILAKNSDVVTHTGHLIHGKALNGENEMPAQKSLHGLKLFLVIEKDDKFLL